MNNDNNMNKYTDNNNSINNNTLESNNMNNDNVANINMTNNNMNNNTINSDISVSNNIDNNILNTTIPENNNHNNNYPINNTVEKINTNNNNISRINKKNIYAIFGFVFAFLFSLLGLIFSIIGLKKSKELGTGSELSIAGLIISLVNTIIIVLFIVTMTSTITNNTKTVTKTIDYAKENAVRAMANMTAEWFELQYMTYKMTDNSNDQEFTNYFKYNDFTLSEKRLTKEIIDRIRKNSTDSLEINYNDSTVKLVDNNRVCVKITATINGKLIQKYSNACEEAK